MCLLVLIFTKMKLLDTVDNNTWHLKNSAKAGISMKISTLFGAIFLSLRITNQLQPRLAPTYINYHI